MSQADEHPRDACGVVGISVAGGRAAVLARAALQALQHRGEESAGVVVVEPGTDRPVRLARGGLVADALPADEVDHLPGRLAVGHVRYSTSGTRSDAGAQPILRRAGGGWLAVAHNGNLVNVADLARTAGAADAGRTDSALVADLLAARVAAGAAFEEALHQVLPLLVGAFSLVLTEGTRVYGVRDPNGLRPLVLGRRPDGWALASETPGLEAAGAQAVREVAPGEVVVIDGEAVRSLHPFPAGTTRSRLCMFEFVYFARADGALAGQPVEAARRRAGEALADHAPPPSGGGPSAHPTPVVVPVPSSAIPAARGYAARSGLAYVEGILCDRALGRSFIAPAQGQRARKVEQKLTVVPARVAGRRVIVIDDSLVRGTTTRSVVRMLREAGAAEVHLRIASPPWRWPCRLGIDAGDREDLVASVCTLTEMAERLGCDSLAYLPLEEALAATGVPADRFCTGCITGRYPVPVPGPEPRPEHELFTPAGRSGPVLEGVPA